MAKRGRPSKYEKINLKQVESLASLGLTDEEIALVLGISRSTLSYYKKKPEFLDTLLDTLKKGKTKADVQIVKSLYDKAKSGDTTAMIFWLKNRQSDKWKDRHASVGINTDGDVTINIISKVPRPIKKKNADSTKKS